METLKPITKADVNLQFHMHLNLGRNPHVWVYRDFALGITANVQGDDRTYMIDGDPRRFKTSDELIAGYNETKLTATPNA